LAFSALIFALEKVNTLFQDLAGERP